MNVRRWKLVSLILVIGILEILYGITGYQSDQQVILQSQSEMIRIKEKKENLEIQKERITDVEKELLSVAMQKQALMNRIPNYKAHSEQMAELMRYMECYDFSNISYQTVENEENDQSIEHIINERYELCFVGRYDEIVDFIECLNAVNQMLRIERIDLSNEVQDLEREENKPFASQYGEDVSEIVQAVIELCLYIKDGDESRHEIYHSDFTIARNSDSLFEWNQSSGEQTMVLEQEEMDAAVTDEIEEGESKQDIQ